MRTRAIASAHLACQPVHADAGGMGVRARARRVARLLAAALLAVAACTAFAQDNGAVDVPPLSLEVYGLDEGLSQLTVSSMSGDDQGFLWVATQDGLNRFDGHRFRAYRNTPGLPIGGPNLVSSSIDSLRFEPGRKRLWLGTNDAGLEVVDLPTWTQRRLGVADGLSHARVTRILLDPAGGAWVGTEAGVDHVDADIRAVRNLGATGEIVGLVWSAARGTPIALDAACGLWSVEASGLVALPAVPGGARRCVALQVGHEGLWVLAADAGLFRLDNAWLLQRHWTPADLGVAAGDATAMIRLEDGRLLTGYSNGGVVQLAPGSDRPRRLRFDKPPGSAITSFHQGASGAWWIGTYTSGLYRVRPLASVIRHDGAGVGTMAGWASHSVRAIRRDGARMLIGTDGGLHMRDRPGAAWRAIAGLADMSVRAIEPARGGGWWIGTQVGLYRLHADGGVEPRDGLRDARVDALLAEDDTLWVGTRSGVQRLRGGRFEPDPRFAPLAGDMVTTFYRDTDGSLWIGTNTRGLWRLHAGVLARVEPSGAGMHRSVWAIHGSADAIWVGAFAAGLYRIDRATGESSVLTERDGLTNNVVYRILSDIGGRLWLSTNLGLSVYDPDSGIVQNLGRRDGLRNQEFNSGSAFQGRDGLLYFGGTMGVDVIAPQQLPRRSAPAHPVLTSLQLLSRQSDTDARSTDAIDIVYTPEIVLDDEDNVFTIGMTAIDFLAPSAAQLRYRVDGLHSGWIYPHLARTEFSLNHLPAGRYRLEVQAAGRDGQFGESRVLTIVMPPPPWRHPLAYVLYALLATLLVALYLRRLRRAVVRERERVDLLNRTVAERTAQLEHANRQLQQSNAQLDAATRLDPLTQVPNRRELQEWLAREAVRAPGRRGSDALFFFMLDIDAFKRINDGHGHQAGDEALVQFAGRMRALTRDGDLLLRWGGEEFMLVARLDDADAAAGLAERMRSTIADTPIALAHGATLRMTCSIGFAPWPLSIAWPTLGDWQQTIALADRCLYAAKDAGRDAWVGLVPGPDADRPRLQALLSGADPATLGDAVRLLYSTAMPPRFER
ncbi:diguanylate cyclase [Luteimonas sp. 3794]|uniref:diguanylate cyclase domain-containing protein n=1 Tax=Luteimonas sp. 3794 TaxID=2817730 RepID=UPI0028585746|nr:diguanylate cyclase [Luteimonas sp. 3794]MDR6990471.1 diguanylate cyclase (GGDEF)-like protein [Luteimonas sp. 3794]